MSFKHLIVGVDLDGPSRGLTLGSQKAIDQALWLAEASDARVDLVHATAADRFSEEIGGGGVVRHVGIPDWGADALDAAMARFEDVATAGQVLVLEGRAADVLPQEAKRHGADLVLLGKRDRPGSLSRPGSVSTRVLRESSAAVWAVDLQDPTIPRVVVAATDLSGGGRAAVELAAELADMAKAALHIVHAYEIPFQLQWDEVAAPTGLEELRKHAQAEVERHVKERVRVQPAGGTKIHIVCTSPEHAVLGAARELKADLVVIGTGKHGVFDNFMLGGTATRVLERVESSLLTVRKTAEDPS